jgi:hypothetical protein
MVYPLLVTVPLGSFFYHSYILFTGSLQCSVHKEVLDYSALKVKQVGESPVNAAELRHDLTNHEDFCGGTVPT